MRRVSRNTRLEGTLVIFSVAPRMRRVSRNLVLVLLVTSLVVAPRMRRVSRNLHRLPLLGMQRNRRASHEARE